MSVLDIDESTDLRFNIYKNSINKLLRKYWWDDKDEFVIEWDGKEPHEYDNLRWKVIDDTIHLKFTSYVHSSKYLLNGYHLICVSGGVCFGINFNLSWRDIKRYIETGTV